MRLPVVLALALAATPLQAGQPISESLVDCAMLFMITNRAEPARANHGKGYALDRAKDKLLIAAQSRAHQEGRDDAERYVADLAGAKAEKWDAKGARYIMTQDYRDWIGYCASLIDHLGLELTD
ncbi:hypothetical protein KPG71_00420 [Roseovarius sp. PS-C2]|uniref:hypothetical protein n=1 Tax=Roseovarius sp. PS-C2 TaxID=2820814 RepID=UPI001C0DF5D1|nr:hypothetical protein [Roseovarius sp. PS-C2]MBU3258467.1 hypothetical protein [Roseovarius sp. PS-C2]